MSVWILGVLVFLVDLVVAFAWTECIKSIGERKAFKSAIWAGFITLSGAFTIISYTSNNWLLIPAVLGGAIGTYLSVKYFKD